MGLFTSGSFCYSFELLDITPAAPDPAPSAETQNRGGSGWQALGETLGKITEAVINSQVPNTEIQSDDNQNSGNWNNGSETENITGNWLATPTLTSHYSPRDGNGDEICEFAGSRSVQRSFQIERSGGEYIVTSNFNNNRTRIAGFFTSRV